jgi:hypothetical protein
MFPVPDVCEKLIGMERLISAKFAIVISLVFPDPQGSPLFIAVTPISQVPALMLEMVTDPDTDGMELDIIGKPL